MLIPPAGPPVGEFSPFGLGILSCPVPLPYWDLATLSLSLFTFGFTSVVTASGSGIGAFGGSGGGGGGAKGGGGGGVGLLHPIHIRFLPPLWILYSQLRWLVQHDT